MAGAHAALAEALEARRAQHLYRERRVVDTAQSPELRVDGRALLAFCSNDYLGLANDPRLVEALQRGAARWGVGSGASDLVCGHLRPHHELEEALAEFTGRESALLFSSGYAANLGVAAAFAGRGDQVFQDRLNHASLIDGALLSGARLRRYAHADAAALGDKLASTGARGALVATDGVFSMDGDEAPLAAIARACARHEALLYVDDAHGIGVLGAAGRGSVEAQGLDAESVPLLMGTLGKALGCSGAFVAGSRVLIDTLLQHARTHTYTTAMPPALAVAALTALGIVRDEPWRRAHLDELVARLRRGAKAVGLSLMPSRTPIQPLVLGDAARALEWSAALQQRGFLVPAIRPPTVPQGAARLRITLSAAHTVEQVDRLVGALAELAQA